MNINSLEEADTISDEEIERRLGITRDILHKCGAHYVINEFEELADVVDDVNDRLRRGENLNSDVWMNAAVRYWNEPLGHAPAKFVIQFVALPSVAVGKHVAMPPPPHRSVRVR